MNLSRNDEHPGTVLIVDPVPTAAQACALLLEASRPVRAISAHSLSTALAECQSRRLDAIILDIAWGKDCLDGLALLQRIRRRDKRTPVLAWSVEGEPGLIRKTIEIGATGYVPKDDPEGDLLLAFDSVRSGRPYLPHEIAVEISFLLSGEDSPNKLR